MKTTTKSLQSSHFLPLEPRAGIERSTARHALAPGPTVSVMALLAGLAAGAAQARDGVAPPLDMSYGDSTGYQGKASAAGGSSLQSAPAGASADAPTDPALKERAWTGFYVGISAGAILNESDASAQHIGLLDGRCNRDADFTNFLPGAHAGYLYRTSSDWVVGAEADFTYPDGSGSAWCRCADSAFDRITVKNRLQGSLRGRLGYSIDKWLPYVTAGVSFADLALGYTNESGEAYGKSTAQAGWVLGGGLEYKLTERVSVRTEYLYSDYGNALGMELPVIHGIGDPSGHVGADLASHTFRLAVNYRFTDW